MTCGIVNAGPGKAMVDAVSCDCPGRVNGAPPVALRSVARGVTTPRPGNGMLWLDGFGDCSSRPDCARKPCLGKGRP